MKIVVSPAKSLNFESPLPIQNYTESLFLKDAETIQKTLKKKKPKQLMELMDISEKLADLNWERNQNWSLPFTPENARPAVFAFDGDVPYRQYGAFYWESQTFYVGFNYMFGGGKNRALQRKQRDANETQGGGGMF